MFLTFNDHKAAVPRFVSLLDYKLTGHLHFRFYIALGTIAVAYICYFLYVNFRKAGLPLYYFIPVPLVLFQPMYYEVSNWALTCLQHPFLTAFLAAAILLVSRGTKPAFYGAMLCCFLATFTHGNGILTFPAIIFFYLCHKDFRNAILTTVFMFACLGIYMAGYESGQAVNLPKNGVVFFSSLFGFLGASMSLWAMPELLSAVWGFAIMVCVVLVTWRVASVYFRKPLSVKPGTIELLSFFAFLFISSTVIALFRSWMGTTIASRFQMYAALSTAVFYIFLLFYTDVLRKKWVYTAVLGFSIFYWAYSYYKFTGIVAAKKTSLLADVYNWQNNRSMFSVERSIQNNASFYLIPGYEKGFFRLPKPVTDKKELDVMFAGKSPVQDNEIYIEAWNIDRVVRGGVDELTNYFVSSNILPQRKHFWDDRFLVMKNTATDSTYLINANPKTEARKNILTDGHYYKTGFNTLLRQDDLDAGTYELGILDVSGDGRKTFYRLDKALVSTGNGYSLK
ncbi:hypothetical protein [Dyadobacter sp. SG02]|uniref:hypothetical protein n=1 Tax=Dyadobacter sp. SG02 TaxID=1855291 RepID=UPI001E30E748|nr:hypothetical protein [Dyadobacter sp. SG02]